MISRVVSGAILFVLIMFFWFLMLIFMLGIYDFGFGSGISKSLNDSCFFRSVPEGVYPMLTAVGAKVGSFFRIDTG